MSYLHHEKLIKFTESATKLLKFSSFEFYSVRQTGNPPVPFSTSREFSPAYPMIRDLLAKEATGVVVVNSSIVLGIHATTASFLHFKLSASCCPVRHHFRALKQGPHGADGVSPAQAQVKDLAEFMCGQSHRAR